MNENFTGRGHELGKTKIWAWQAKLIAHEFAESTPHTKLKIKHCIKSIDLKTEEVGWAISGTTSVEATAEQVGFNIQNDKSSKIKFRSLYQPFFLFVIDKSNYYVSNVDSLKSL